MAWTDVIVVVPPARRAYEFHFGIDLRWSDRTLMEEHILPALRTYLTDVFAGLTADQADGMWFEVRNGAGYEPPQVSALYRGLDAVLNELATKFDKDITGLLIALIGTQSAGGVHDWMQH